MTKADLWEVLTQIKSSRRRDSPETREEETRPIGTTVLVRTPGPIQLPNAGADETLLTPGDTLDDEELWDAFTRDDREAMLCRLLGDSDVGDNSPEESDARYGSAYETRRLEDPDGREDTLSNSYSELAYRTYKSEDEDDEAFYDKGYYDDKDKYRVTPSEKDDDEALDFDEGERDDTQPRGDEEHSGYKTPLQRTCPVNPADGPQHEDDKSPGDDGDTPFDPSNGLTGRTYGTEDSDDEYGILLQRDHDAYLQRKDDQPFYGEARYDVQPFIDEGHDEDDNRKEIKRESRDPGRAHYLTATPATTDDKEEVADPTKINERPEICNVTDRPTRAYNDTTLDHHALVTRPKTTRAHALSSAQPSTDESEGGNVDPAAISDARLDNEHDTDEESARCGFEQGTSRLDGPCNSDDLDNSSPWPDKYSEDTQRTQSPSTATGDHEITAKPKPVPSVGDPRNDNLTVTVTCHVPTDNDPEEYPGGAAQTPTGGRLITEEARMVTREVAVPPTPTRRGADPVLPPPPPARANAGQRSPPNDPTPSLCPCWAFLASLILAPKFRAWRTGTYERTADYADGGDPSTNLVIPARARDIDIRRWSYANPSAVGRHMMSHDPDDRPKDAEDCGNIPEIAPTLPQFTQRIDLGYDCNPLVGAAAFRDPVTDYAGRDVDAGATDILHADDADDPVTGTRDDAWPTRSRNGLTYHEWPRSRAMPKPRVVTLLSLLSQTPDARYPCTPSPDGYGLHPTTHPAHILPPMVIMEDDRLRRGVISRLSRFVTVSPTINDLTNANTAYSITNEGETTTSQHRLRVTQPTKHKVTHEWGDIRHLRDYTSAEEIPVDPTKRRKYQIMLREQSFKGVKLAIRTVLVPYPQRQTTNAAGDVSDDETCVIPAYDGSAISHRMRKAGIARWDDSQRDNNVDRLDQPRRQESPFNLLVGFVPTIHQPRSDTHGPNFDEPAPDLVDGEEEWEVEAILGERCHGRGKAHLYLIRWKGFSAAHDSWERATDIHAPECIKVYHEGQLNSIEIASLELFTMPPTPEYFPYFDEAELEQNVHDDIEDQVWLWANVEGVYNPANDSPITREDMAGTTTIQHHNVHMRPTEARNRHRRRLQREAVEHVREQEQTAQRILTGEGERLVPDVIDLEEDSNQSPGDSWRAAYAEEQYQMDIPLGTGGRGPARYLRFALDPEQHPVMLGSEGYGYPAYSQGLYAHDQPTALRKDGDEDLQIYDTQFTSRHEVDKALVLLADPGVCADVLRYRQAMTRKNELLGKMREFERRWADWAALNRGIERRLRHANVPSRLTPFLTTPLTLGQPVMTLTLDQRRGRLDPEPPLHRVPLPGNEDTPRWLFPPSQVTERPQLHDEEVRSNIPLPACVYCGNEKHLSFECRTPHVKCQHLRRCVVPTAHVHVNTLCQWRQRDPSRFYRSTRRTDPYPQAPQPTTPNPDATRQAPRGINMQDDTVDWAQFTNTDG
ncbi:hypothetical protein EDB83DRAFT_2658852 [Lactarius deliciosus]|nr:hypothetical protein EDB83DRAFT_2658852 [Lactarius deliciosus]